MNTTAEPSKKSTLQLELCATGRLGMRDEAGKLKAVNVSPCFPWSHPESFISLRDDDNKELGFIDDLDALDPTSKALVSDALSPTKFTFEITEIRKIDRDFELRTWRVETNRGPRSFQTMLDSHPRVLPDGTVLIKDLAGDLYQINDPQSLDRRSRHRLSIYID
ncbi:MAG: DUF1854 domain-containing protein [Opitutales bacterium]|nr:DUF1854 domain-containing protein [Opitutales bacterium]